MLFIAFAAVCVPVFAVALFFLARAMLAGIRVTHRAKALVPRTLISQVRFAQLDAKRIASAFKAIGALAPRAAIASASIVASLNTYRALLARLRELA
ncbi:MAG TPA: hypothetical protein VMD07_04135 [Candidatus Acidoferrales bacterium]|nr:hypothetical protein [Candidatus Acidoferrales bacterium]